MADAAATKTAIEIEDYSAGVPVKERDYSYTEHICDDRRWHGYRCWCLPVVHPLDGGRKQILHRDLQ